MLITGFAAGPLAANCYLIAPPGGDECVVIDPGQSALEPLREVLSEHSLRPAAVLLTHGHFDHTASARAVCDEFGIATYLHAADQYMLADPLAALSPEFRAAIPAYLGPDDDLTRMRPTELLDLAHQQVLDIAGLAITVLAVPGHTGGSVVYQLPGQGERPEVLFTGDTLFAASIGRTDLPGGSTEQIMRSIRDELLTRPDETVVLPGHGSGSTIGTERRHNPFLAGA